MTEAARSVSVSDPQPDRGFFTDLFHDTADQITRMREQVMALGYFLAAAHCADTAQAREAFLSHFDRAKKEWDNAVEIATGTSPIPGLPPSRIAWIRGSIAAQSEWLALIEKTDRMICDLRAACETRAPTFSSDLLAFSAYAIETLQPSVTEMVGAIWQTTNYRRDEALASAKKGRDAVARAMLEIGEISLGVRLIALNASVEASHAGDAGRGFAVIAQEIKSLSHQIEATVKRVENDIDALDLD